MKYNPDLHHRRSIRLKDYNYAHANLYFITLCCQHRTCLFGYISNENMCLNKAGQMVAYQWQQLTTRFNHILLHDFIVMPNHFHGIIELTDSAQPQTLGDMVGAFKSLSTCAYIQGVKHHSWQTFDKKLWQRNYYEHIIRDQKAYESIVDYIQTNAARWQDDTYYSQP